MKKYGNMEAMERVNRSLEDAARILKQMAMSIGFFLSFYKEIEDLDELSCFGKPDFSHSVSEVLSRYNLNEVFTDGDEIQSVLDEIEELRREKTEMKRSKSSVIRPQVHLDHLPSQTIKVNEKKKEFHNHQGCFMVGDKQTRLKQELEQAKFQVKKLTKEVSEKDTHLQVLKKKLELTSDKKFLLDRIMLLEDALDETTLSKEGNTSKGAKGDGK